MQYLYEKLDGDRVKLTKSQYEALCKKTNDVRHMVKTSTVAILTAKAKKPVNMDRFKPLAWGGSRRQHNCFDPTYAKGSARVHQIHLD